MENGTSDERWSSCSPVQHDPSEELQEHGGGGEESSSSSSSPDTSNNPDHSAAGTLSSRPPERVTYSVGDHCFFETSASGPYQIRRLDEFVKNGNSVDAKVFIYSRKSDLPSAVQKEISGFVDGELDDGDAPLAELIAQRDTPNPRRRRRQLEHLTASREVFLNKDDGGPVMETLPTSLIRGKCSVLHHVEGAPKFHYTEMDNVFFYHRAWYVPTDLQTGEVVMDREKEIHHDSDGSYQASIPDLLTAVERLAYAASPSKETALWTPYRLKDDDVTSFIQAAVAVGLMARSVNVTTIASLALREEADTVARIAGMDCTFMAAHDLLHEYDYDISRAVHALVGSGLWSKRTLLETFDDTDMAFFRIGLHESSRNLKMIHEDWLPWRSYADIVGFYYLFKSTSYYKTFRSTKAGAKHDKGIISCVSVAVYDARSCLLRHVPEEQVCYGCYESSEVWYAWTGLARSRRQVRAVCGLCWSFWKRYGCLSRPWRCPTVPFRSNLIKPAGTTPARLAMADCHPSFTSPKQATTTTGKQLLLTHRSPQAPSLTQKWSDDMWVVEKSQADEEEFVFNAGDEWRLARRVATESLYHPKLLARYPLLACGDTDRTNAYLRTCPGLVVDYYKQRMGRKRGGMDDVISRIGWKRRSHTGAACV